MKSVPVPVESARQERVLAVALDVFGRYGFRKTSMEEVARSAEISRQALYLRYANKEALFRAAVRQELDNALSEASRCLDEHGTRLDDRVVSALDAWLGRFVGSTLASDIGNLLENSTMHLGDMVTESIAAFEARLSAAIAVATTEDDRRRLGVTSDEVSAMLHTMGRGWKYQVSSRTEFVARITAAVRLVLAGFTTPTKGSS
jgi:AcrR family transcriptional regulator